MMMQVKLGAQTSAYCSLSISSKIALPSFLDNASCGCRLLVQTSPCCCSASSCTAVFQQNLVKRSHAYWPKRANASAFCQPSHDVVDVAVPERHEFNVNVSGSMFTRWPSVLHVSSQLSPLHIQRWAKSTARILRRSRADSKRQRSAHLYRW